MIHAGSIHSKIAQISQPALSAVKDYPQALFAA
jgi:hypothetical protein